MSERKVCLDLFAGLGGFSAAFADSDEWDIYTVEIDDDFDPDLCADVLDLRASDLLELIGEHDHLVVLAGHPCTFFTFIRRITTGGDSAWVDASTPSVRRWVKEAAEVVAEEIDDERWLDVSSHDLRRSWATYHLVERQVDVRTMMSIGGWSDYSAIEPYLAEPTEARIGSAMG
jgi:hypothetical protein